MHITNAMKLEELRRELRKRHDVYPRLVREDRLSPEVAALRVMILERIIEDYERALKGSVQEGLAL